VPPPLEREQPQVRRQSSTPARSHRRLAAALAIALVSVAAGSMAMAAGATGATSAPPAGAALGPAIAALQTRVGGLQADLARQRRRLLGLRDRLTAADRRLGSLVVAKAAAERVLAEQLVGRYEAQPPDIVDVVLEATGMTDLLERIAFIQRIGAQDARITAHVRSARRAVADEARSLGALTAGAQQAAERLLATRDQVARVRLSLVARQLAAARAQAAAAGRAAAAQLQVVRLSHRLAALKAAQPHGAGTARPTPSGASVPFPMPAADAAPPATWTVGQGVDIAAPVGTVERAVCTGTIVLHGIGGLGPYAPVLRCDTPIEGHAYVYYGFAGARRLAPLGADVTVGQRVAEVGGADVGAGGGAQLELGFADAGGTPLGGAGAQMLALLRRAYAS
jgi:murein DD-endopeptidase MepM/ murein hydrolase activator NlpD